MYHDDGRKDYAAISVPSARAFAVAAGLNFQLHTATRYSLPFMQKVLFMRAALADSERVIYSDIDVVFRPGAADAEALFSGPFSMSVDLHGFCTGFMAFTKSPEVERLLRVWWDLGMLVSDDNSATLDQGTFKIIHRHFDWAKALVREIPTTLVSNPECGELGAVAHHVWSRDDRLDRMQNLKWELSSAVECLAYTQEAAGAAPAAPTICLA